MLMLMLLSQACTRPLSPKTPQLLKGVTGRGGWTGVCFLAPETEVELLELYEGKPTPRPVIQSSNPDDRLRATIRKLAHSPEIVQRLRARFPPGSSAAELEEFLRAETFQTFGRCDQDSSIGFAQFRQNGGSALGPFPMFATVNWKEDHERKIIWVHGQVSFMGL